MDRLKTTLLSAFVLAILLTPTAFAQATASTVEIISGSGQLVCPICSFGNPLYKSFYPLVVKVTDASGNPIPNKTVEWTTVGPTGSLNPIFFSSTFTDSNGLTINPLTTNASVTGSAQLPFVQLAISATADGASATFFETQALTDSNSVKIVNAKAITEFGTQLKGPAGSTSGTPIQVFVSGYSVPVPNVSLRLVKTDVNGTATASCARGLGADPGSVLTDASGTATCYPVFGSSSGSGPISLEVGGLDPANFDYTGTPRPLSAPVAYQEYENWVRLVVDPVTPGRISIVSGDNQTLNPGQASSPLVVVVQDASGVVNISNTPVQWTVSPAGAATLTNNTSTTNSQGQAQTTANLSPSAVGQVTIQAALTGANSGVSTKFTLSVNVQISSMSKVSGDTQTSPANQNFPNPLIVQLTGTNGQPVVNQPVSFVVTGGSATLSSSSANTDGNGRAQVTVRAGATAGPVTVSAAVGNISQTFTLTVIPPGPSLSSNSFFSVGGASRISELAPCSLVTVVASGLAPNIQNQVLNSNSFGPWAGTLASDSVSVGNTSAPIASVGVVNGLEQITFQVPCGVAVSSSVPVTINVGGGTGTVNMPVVVANPGILETVMTDNVRRAVIVRPDGTFVSLQNPARRGEVVRIFVTGLGPTSPSVGTGSLPVPGTDALVTGSVIVGVQNAGARVVTSRLAPNLIGVAEVAFQVPSDAPTGNDVVLNVVVNVPGDSQTSRYSNGTKIPIQ